MGNNLVAPRSPITQQLPYFRRLIAFNTLNIGTAGVVPLGTLPAYGLVYGALIKITEAFNAGTTNVLTVGTAADASAVIGATDVNELVAGTTIPLAASGYYVTVDTPLWVKYAQTGTAASTGAAIICLTFFPNNDR